MFFTIFTTVAFLFCFEIASSTQNEPKKHERDAGPIFTIMETLKEFKTEMEKSQREMKESIADLSKAQSQMKESMVELKGEIAGLKNDVSTINVNINKSSKDVAILKELLKNTNGNITSLKSMVMVNGAQALLPSYVNVLVPSNELVFYPYGTTQQVALKHYKAYGLTYGGFGYSHSYDSYVDEHHVRLEKCITYCHAVRQERGGDYNGMDYRISTAYCRCYKHGSNFEANHDYLHYKFV